MELRHKEAATVERFDRSDPVVPCLKTASAENRVRHREPEDSRCHRGDG
jgi:hypothetical protein